MVWEWWGQRGGSKVVVGLRGGGGLEWLVRVVGV